MSEPKFLEGNLMRHVAVMSFTSSIGLMALFAVDFVDMIFIGMLGETALAAAVGYAGVILFFTISANIGIAIAVGALMAQALGRREPERARLYASNVLIFGGMVSTVLAVILWLSVPEVLRFLGAQGETLSAGVTYLRIVVPSMPVLMLAMAGGSILRAHGDANRAMWSTIIGGLVNAILDPIFIFSLGLGLNGAAIASVIARLAVAIAAFWPIFKRHGGLAPTSLESFRADLGRIVSFAAPAIMTNIATPIGTAYLTRAVAQFGDQAVAGMAIMGRLSPVAFAVIFALSGAVGPIIGQNFGARRYDRVRETLIAALQFTGLYVLAIAVVLYLVRDGVVMLFSAKGLTQDIIYLFCGPLALAYFFNGAVFVSNAAFNNLNRPFFSTLLNWGRHTLGTIPFVIVGAGMAGALGALIGQAAGGVFFGPFGIFTGFRLIRAYERGDIDPDAPRRRSFRWPIPINPFNAGRGG